jgi:lipoate-protein ligase A
MAVDESILEHIARGETGPTLRVYAWEPACLSLGHAQSFADVDVTRLQWHGWEVVRRPTGGRAILHTDELTYSVITPSAEPRLAGSVLESYNRLAQALLQAIRTLGMEACSNSLSPAIQANAGTIHNSPNPICFEVPSAYEITVDGRKLIGSAQARRKEGVLQHGSLPLKGDLSRITDALIFPDDAARLDAARHLLERATTVECALGCTVSWDEAARALVRAFESELDLYFETADLSRSELARAAELVDQKYNHPDWMKRV